MSNYKPSLLKRISDIALRIYAIFTIIVAGIYINEKYFVEFSDINHYAPPVFLEDSYVKTDDITFYSWIGTSVEGSPLTLNDPLFCQSQTGVWERVISPTDKTFFLKIDYARNELIKYANIQMIEYGGQNSENYVDFVRTTGNELASSGDGFSILYYDTSNINFDLPTMCRMQVYASTQTSFFHIIKTEKYFSNQFELTNL